jgi:STE24 endopeptidase
MSASASSAALHTDLPSEPQTREAKRYHKLKLIGSIVALVLSMAYLAIVALWLGPKLGRMVQIWTNNEWLRLIVFAFVYAAGAELLTLPLDFWSGFILEHRFGLSNQTLLRWIWREVKGYLVGGPLGLVMVVGLYALLWFTRPWWLWAALAWLAMTLVLGRIVPILILPLFYKVAPLDDASLRERLERIAAGTGLSIEGIYRLHLSAETKKANAALAGLGRSRRVLLGDTLLDGFTPEEIEVVFAHEVGHHVHRHLMKFVALSVVLAGVGLWLVDVVLRHAAVRLGYESFADPAALPLVLLVLGLFGLVLMPLQNAISRYFEGQCDRYALERTGNHQAYRSAFLKLANLNKADMEPHPLVVWLFHDHPPIEERVILADAGLVSGFPPTGDQR